MPKPRHQNQLYIEQQHKLRGLVSGFRSREFRKKTAGSPASNFRLSIRALLLEARVSLHANQFRKFLEWTDSLIDSQIPELARASIGFDELRGIITDAPIATLETELVWVSERIRVESKKISLFRHKATEIERLAFCGELEESIKCIQSVEDELGASIWAVQLRIALEQQTGGLDRQKRYSAKVRRVFRQGLLGFIGYNTSARNEDKTTIPKYLADVKSRIEKHRFYDNSVKKYLLYRLAGESADSVNGMADILRVEQSHSILDVYETFVFVIQDIVRREDLFKFKPMALNCLASINSVDDYRLLKARHLLDRGYTPAPLPQRDTTVSDMLISGNVLKSALASRRLARPNEPVDPWHIIYAGFAFSHTTRSRKSSFSRPQDIPLQLGRFLSRDDDSFEAMSDLSKLCANFNGFPAVMGIVEIIGQLHRKHPNAEIHPYFVGMNSPTIGIEDFATDKISEFDMSDDNRPQDSTTRTSWISFSNPTAARTDESGFSTLLAVAGLLRQGSYSDALDLIESSAVLDSSESIRALTILAKLHAHYSLGDRQDVIDLIVKEGTRSTSRQKLLPIRESLKGYTWIDYKYLPEPITAPLALHMLWAEHEGKKTASLLRFATREFLNSTDTGLPSALFDHASDFSKQQLIYFLSKVCVPIFIDHASALGGTGELLEERQRVCAALRLLDPDNSDIYELEISEITQRQAMLEGQWIVDRTRIHVDSEALKRWANRQLSESFNRYKDLLDVDVDIDFELDKILNEVLNEPVVPYKPFVPKTEAEIILANMLDQVGDEFMRNPSFGLDFYLSKRIRHQSFIGLIRGPVEFSELITTRESLTDAYRKNEKWLGKFTELDQDSFQAIDKAFLTFSESFDAALTSAKDERFQIRSPEHRDGLLYLQLQQLHVFLLNTIGNAYDTLDEFIELVVIVLWTSMEPSLAEVRRFIGDDLKTKIVLSFDQLRATVGRRAGHDSSPFLELDPVIGKCSADVQRELDVASQWFTRVADLNAVQRVFELDQMLSIAIDSSLRCQRAFEPKISKEVIDGNTKMAASALVFIHDVLFVALDNAHAHSGLNEPNIHVFAKVDADAETLSLTIRSEVSSQVDQVSAEKELETIRALIDARDFERRTSKEGGSGFIKVAAVAYQRAEGRTVFGFTENCEFQLSVVYSMNIEPIPLETGNE